MLFLTRFPFPSRFIRPRLNEPAVAERRIHSRSSAGLAGGDERVLGGRWRVLAVRPAVEGEAALEGDAVALGGSALVLGAEEEIDEGVQGGVGGGDDAEYGDDARVEVLAEGEHQFLRERERARDGYMN